MYIQNGKSPVMLIRSRYNLDVERANVLVHNWLTNNLQKSSLDLFNSIKIGKVILKEQELFEIPDLSLEQSTVLASKIQRLYNLEIKDRWYHLKCYKKCFIGSELVDCLVKNQSILQEEAIVIGQNLLQHNLISHVCNDHEFKNEFLFYRFQK